MTPPEVRPAVQVCPKCGETVFTGPAYRGRSAVMLYGKTFMEAVDGMEWACTRCGWTHTTRPLDYVAPPPLPHAPPPPDPDCNPNTEVPDGPRVLDWLRRLVS